MSGDVNRSYFFCGIGGSGMLPLAKIISARGGQVRGSDRSRDQGRLVGKFAALEAMGVRLFAQDGSGVRRGDVFVTSAAVEDSNLDVLRARELGCIHQTRAALNAELFNSAEVRIGIAGTSGKSTVTAMVAWIMNRCGLCATVMNGAETRSPPESASETVRTVKPLESSADYYLSEVDESDGSIALYQPHIAVVTNISLDHKSLDELQGLFVAWVRRARCAIVNADDSHSAILRSALAQADSEQRDRKVVSFGFAATADLRARDYEATASGCRFAVDSRLSDRSKQANTDSADKAAPTRYQATLAIAGRYNIANALAAIAVGHALDIAIADSLTALADFPGVARRYERVGEAGGVTIYDDFAHNPDKISASLAAMRELPSRALVFFQPHGYGPLRHMGAELATSFADNLRAGDRLFLCDPVYFGGTVDRSGGSGKLAADIIAACQPPRKGANKARGKAVDKDSARDEARGADMSADISADTRQETEQEESRDTNGDVVYSNTIAGGDFAGDVVYLANRAQCGAAMCRLAQAGDRILILGARDDTLHDFAHELLAILANRASERAS